jgi:hypothetical protein
MPTFYKQQCQCCTKKKRRNWEIYEVKFHNQKQLQNKRTNCPLPKVFHLQKNCDKLFIQHSIITCCRKKNLKYIHQIYTQRALCLIQKKNTLLNCACSVSLRTRFRWFPTRTGAWGVARLGRRTRSGVLKAKCVSFATLTCNNTRENNFI